MNEIEDYIRSVIQQIEFLPAEKQRLEDDLRAHFEDAVHSGESPQAIIARMGAPQEVAQAFLSQIQLRYAGFWPRLAAFLIDVLLVVTISLVLLVVAIAASNQVPERAPTVPEMIDGLFWIGILLSVGLAIVGLILLYFPILEGRYGQTVGKRLLNLWVRKESGLAIGFKEAFLRRVSFYFEVFAIDALFIPFTEKRQRAFDIVARTVVVYGGARLSPVL